MAEDKGELVLDIGKIEGQAKKAFKHTKNIFMHNKYVIPIILILIAILFSSYFRLFPASLPVTDQWAENSVYSGIQSNIVDQVLQENPNLPSDRVQAIANEQFLEVIEANKDQIQPLIEDRSNYFKSRFQDEDGQTYLLAIDPYLWYGSAKNYLECGHVGCQVTEEDYYSFRSKEPKLVEEGSYHTLRNGRFGIRNENLNLMAFIGIIIFKIMNIFSDTSLLSAFFLIPVILIGLSIIPAFLIGKKLGGNVGGFFAAMIIAVNGALLGRTPAGFSDTDSANILFPLLLMWLFLEAYDAKDLKKSVIYSLFGGLTFYIYSKIWFPEYLFDFMLAAIILMGALVVGREIIKHKSIKKEFFMKLKGPFMKGALFLVVSIISLIIATKGRVIITMVSSILNFVVLKGVAVKSLWPNVLTTVAEFNEVPFASIIGQMGGKFLFWLAILGIVLTGLKKYKGGKRNLLYPILLTIWFIGTAYSFTKGMRFALLLVPAFAIAFGACMGILHEFIVKWVSKNLESSKVITQIVIFIVFCFLLISPVKAANNIALNEIPSYNDAWDQTLNEIKLDAEDGIGYITTWWDFGHWFVANGVRVTMDGGDQNSIHYGGKSFLTSDEQTSVGILKMLNCGQNYAPNMLDLYFNNDTVRAVQVLDTIMLQDKENAEVTLKSEDLSDEQIENVLERTHCEDLMPHYLIASEDMIGKAGVWGHFGSWNFTKAKIWQTIKGTSYNEGIKILEENFSISKELAPTIYTEVQQTKADQWISPWPGYYSGLTSCAENNGLLQCQNGLEVELSTMNAYVYTQQGRLSLDSLGYLDENGNFVVKEYSGNVVPQSAILLPNGQTMFLDPLHVGSMFTRLFFFKGEGLEHFELFSETNQVTGGKIQVWKVNWGLEEKDSSQQLSEALEEVEISSPSDSSSYDEATETVVA